MDERSKVMRKIMGYMRRALNDYDMIQEGDHVAVGLSGGKDSLVMLHLIKQLDVNDRIPVVYVDTGLEYQATKDVMKDVAKKFTKSMQTFEGASEEEAQLLHRFALICMLSYDIYIKKAIYIKRNTLYKSRRYERIQKKKNKR